MIIHHIYNNDTQAIIDFDNHPLFSFFFGVGQQHQFRGLMPRSFFTDLGIHHHHHHHQRKSHHHAVTAAAAAAIVGSGTAGGGAVVASGGGGTVSGAVTDYTSTATTTSNSINNNATTFTIKFPPAASISSSNSTPGKNLRSRSSHKKYRRDLILCKLKVICLPF